MKRINQIADIFVAVSSYSHPRDFVKYGGIVNTRADFRRVRYRVSLMTKVRVIILWQITACCQWNICLGCFPRMSRWGNCLRGVNAILATALSITPQEGFQGLALSTVKQWKHIGTGNYIAPNTCTRNNRPSPPFPGKKISLSPGGNNEIIRWRPYTCCAVIILHRVACQRRDNLCD